MFRKVSVDASEKPDAVGSHQVFVTGMRSFMPIFLEFDGKEWLGLNELKNKYPAREICWVAASLPYQPAKKVAEAVA